MESSWAYSDKSAIGIDISRYSNSSFPKTTALNSVKVWIDGFLILDFFPQCLRHGFWYVFQYSVPSICSTFLEPLCSKEKKL